MKLIVSFLISLVPLFSDANEDFVAAACSQDTSKMSQIYATTDVDLNFIGKNGKTALTCGASTHNLDVIVLLTRLKHGNLNINALDGNGDGVISAAVGQEPWGNNCFEKCRALTEKVIELFGAQLDLEAHRIGGKVLTITDLPISYKLLFKEVPSFAKIINARDANGQSLIDQYVSKLATTYSVAELLPLFKIPNIDLSGLKKIPFNYLNINYIHRSSTRDLAVYLKFLAANKSAFPTQLGTSFFADDYSAGKGNNLISVAFLAHGETIANFLLTEFDFSRETLLHKNEQQKTTCNFVFGTSLFEKLKDKNALTPECIDFANEANFARYELVPLSNYSEFQKSYPTSYMNKSQYFIRQLEDGRSVVFVDTYERTEQEYIYIFDQQQWPPKLIKRFDFEPASIQDSNDIVLTAQGNLLLSLYMCGFVGCEKRDSRIGGIDLATQNLKMVEWRKHDGDYISSGYYDYYNYQGLAYEVSGWDFGYHFWTRNNEGKYEAKHAFSLEYFEPPTMAGESLTDPSSVQMWNRDFPVTAQHHEIAYCLDATHCLAYGSSPGSVTWLILEGQTWRKLESQYTHFMNDFRSIVFPDNSFIVGWLGVPNDATGWPNSVALIYNPKTQVFSIGNARKDYGTHVVGTNLKVTTSPTQFGLVKVEVKDQSNNLNVGICYVPEGRTYELPMNFSKEHMEIQFLVEGKDSPVRSAPQFVKARCE